MATRRDPEPGEKCVCGRPAVVVYLTKLGQVPVCEEPKVGLIPKGPGHGVRPSRGER